MTSRRLREVCEPIAAMSYFAPEPQEAMTALGLSYLPGYVCGRAAPLGLVASEVVVAAFGVFEPGLVRASLAEGRAAASPDAVLSARVEAAGRALARMAGDATDSLAPTVARLRRAVIAADPAGHVMYAARLVLPWPDDPFEALWWGADLFREHRGDSHLAAWSAAGLDAVEVCVLTACWTGQRTGSRTAMVGWAPEATDAAVDRLRARGLVGDGAGDGRLALTAAGRAVRDAIEDATDRQQHAIVATLGDDVDGLVGLLRPIADAVVAAGGYPFAVT